jgi:hypothetical protein
LSPQIIFPIFNYVIAVKLLAIISEATVKDKRMLENDSCENVIYMLDVQEPEKVNDTCVKTMHTGTMDRGFTVYNSIIIVTMSQQISKT